MKSDGRGKRGRNKKGAETNLCSHLLSLLLLKAARDICTCLQMETLQMWKNIHANKQIIHLHNEVELTVDRQDENYTN